MSSGQQYDTSVDADAAQGNILGDPDAGFRKMEAERLALAAQSQAMDRERLDVQVNAQALQFAISAATVVGSQDIVGTAERFAAFLRTGRGPSDVAQAGA